MGLSSSRSRLHCAWLVAYRALTMRARRRVSGPRICRRTTPAQLPCVAMTMRTEPIASGGSGPNEPESAITETRKKEFGQQIGDNCHEIQ